jgi:SSS family solute:Na+ symporter
MNPSLSLTALDWIFLSLGILLGPLYVLVKSSKSPSTFMEQLSMGRKLTLPLFVVTIVSTWYGGILGVTDLAYQKGIYNFITQGLFWYLSYLFFAWFMIKKIRPLQAYTLPEIVRHLYGERAEKIAALLNFINLLPMAYAVSIGYLLQFFLGGELWLNSLIGVLFVCLYSSWSGLRAVVYSDAIQFVFMFLAVSLVVIFSFSEYGGVSFLSSSLPEHYFSPQSDLSPMMLFVWALIATTTLIDPNFYHRCLVAQNEKTARRGIFIATSIWFVFDICTTLGGMYARAILGPQTELDSPYLEYALGLLPPGLKGIFLAGVFATVLSTLDSFLFLSSATLGHHLLPKRWQDKKRVQTVSVFAIGLLSVPMAMIFSGQIADMWLFTGGLSAAILLIPMLFGLYSTKRFSPKSFLWSSGLSLATMLIFGLPPFSY